MAKIININYNGTGTATTGTVINGTYREDILYTVPSGKRAKILPLLPNLFFINIYSHYSKYYHSSISSIDESNVIEIAIGNHLKVNSVLTNQIGSYRNEIALNHISYANEIGNSNYFEYFKSLNSSQSILTQKISRFTSSMAYSYSVQTGGAIILQENEKISVKFNEFNATFSQSGTIYRSANLNFIIVEEENK